jgi:processive 1,2-diacylglycerol beta-glucosyltransferase
MKILILSCKTGGGHNAAAQAMKEHFESQGDTADFFEYLKLSSPSVNDFVGHLYVAIAKNTPWLFGIIYRIGMRVGTTLHRVHKRSPVYYVNALMGKRLASFLQDNPYDAILMPHLYPAETMTYIKEKFPDMHWPKTFAISTDYTCIPFWEETTLDYYIIPNEELTGEYVKRGISASKIIPLGIPVSNDYITSCDDKKTREKLGIPDKKKCVLVMGGSMGFGNVNRLVEELHRKSKGYHIVVVCGSNQRLEKTLHARYIFSKDVTIIGYTKHVAQLMHMSTVLFTKAGGLTSTEAAACSCPVVFTQSIPGCEYNNMGYFLRHGGAVTGKTIEEQVRHGITILNNDKLSNKMKQQQRISVNQNAGRDIVTFIKKVCKAK